MKYPTNFPQRQFAMAAAASFLSMAVHAAPALPPLTPATGLGVNIHFTQADPGEIEMIAAAGFKWVRMDLTWANTEKVKGVYDFSAYDRLLAGLDAQKMHAILILDYGNPLYARPGDRQPYTSQAGTEEFRTAFANWAAAAVKHFAGRGCIWEIWNEPNFKPFWAPAPKAADYVALAKATAAAVHEVAPNEPLIGPALSTFDMDYLEDCFRAGLLDDLSAVSVHPYRDTDPAQVANDYQRLRTLIAQYSNPDRPIPILCTEWGYSTAWKNVDEATQAKYAVGEFSAGIASGVPLSIWYDWRDDSGGPVDGAERHFGLVHHDFHPGKYPPYDPKPAYFAMKAFAARLAAQPASSPAP